MLLSAIPVVFSLQLLWWVIWGTVPNSSGASCQRSPVESNCKVLPRKCLGWRGSLGDSVAGRKPGSLYQASPVWSSPAVSASLAVTWAVRASTSSLLPGAMVSMKWLRSEALGYCSLEDTYECRARRVVACHFGSGKFFPPEAVGA